MDVIAETTYSIRNLGTKSVTLFPTKAQVTREIKDVALKPGVNEVTIIGLSPTVDEHSVKVEGTGSAIISDILVEKRPNHEHFDDIYPESDDDNDDTDDNATNNDPFAIENADASSSEDDADEELKRLKRASKEAAAKMTALGITAKHIADQLLGVNHRLEFLDQWSRTLSSCANTHEVDAAEKLATHQREREKLLEEKRGVERQERDFTDEQGKVARGRNRVDVAIANREEKLAKQRMKDQKAEQKEEDKKRRDREERQKEKERIREERASFWPKYCYAVKVTLEAAAWTPASSRRGSVASEAEVAKTPEADDASGVCSLVLSYVTTSAYWIPSYDMQLSTIKASGNLCFDAHLRNATSETWKDCRITLSTSQATFTGLEDTMPTLHPWYIKLAPKGGAAKSTSDVLFSRHELAEKEAFKKEQNTGSVPKPRSEMFGAPQLKGRNGAYNAQLRLLEQQNRKRLLMARQVQQQTQVQYQMQQQQQQSQHQKQLQSQMRQQQQPAQPLANYDFDSFLTEEPSMTVRQAAAVPESVPPRGGTGRGVGGAMRHRKVMRDDIGESGPESDSDGADGFTLQPEPPQALEFQESQVEETGLTTTYDLPGLKTLAPQTSKTKQRVARIALPGVVFSHIVVPKYRPIAYLKAKMRNNSRMTFLAGATGLTVDGSFMGRTKLPRCSPGESLSLSLGADPALKIVYPRADVRRGTSGILNKEDSAVYVRTITLFNTRTTGGRALSIDVRDQIPVSEDDKLRVAIVNPSHMVPTGGPVSTGLPGRDGDDRNWGTASARVKKNGEVTWDVNLNAGRTAKLVLEYSVAAPSADRAVEC